MSDEIEAAAKAMAVADKRTEDDWRDYERMARLFLAAEDAITKLRLAAVYR